MPAYDHSRRRRSLRRGEAERGAWIYLTAEELRKAGIDPAAPPPFYRTWGSSTRGERIIVNLYREP